MVKSNAIISLFSGAMGLDLGLEKAGFRTAVAVEINPNAVKTIRSNKPFLPVIDRRIEEVSTNEILRVAGLKVGEACIVTGGPCCQSFSTMGKRRSITDSRGELFRHFERVILEAQPRFFVMENVKGILSAAIHHRPLKMRGPGRPPLTSEELLGSAFQVILKELSELGYYITYGLLNSADFGTPQVRMRVIIIGSRDGENISLPEPTHSNDGSCGRTQWVTLKETICRINDNEPEYIKFTPERMKFLKRLKEGQNWKNLPKNLQRAALGAAFDSWGGRVGFCRRLSWEKPSPTLTTTPVGRATTLCHPTRLRPLSIKEYAKLQQFPTSWKFLGSTTQKYIQIGNAVPIGLGQAIGQMLKQTMEHTLCVGLSENAQERKGKVECSDMVLASRLQKRRKTQLEPVKFRLTSDLDAARKWLESCA